jgi:hypothetical protein
MANRARTLALLLVAALPGLAIGQLSEEDSKEVAAYPLAMEKVEKAFKASTGLQRLLRNDPALARDLEARDLQDQIRRFEGSAKVKDALRPLGITPRDFCLTMKAIAMARMAAMMPPTLPHPAASSDHIKFYREHQGEIEKLEEQQALPPEPSPAS